MFPERLKNLRQRDSLSQKKLSEIIGFSQQSIAKWETGAASPTPDIVAELADIFHVSTDYLLGKSNDQAPPSEKKDPLDGLKFALWGSDEISDAALDDVRRYAEFVAQREKGRNDKLK